MDPELRKPLIIGNWKMHGTLTESIKLATTLKNLLVDVASVDMAVAPPFTALYSVSIALAETNLRLAGQDLFWEDEGPFTGEVSGLFLKDVGCEMVIVGHSERRMHFGETDKVVGQKVQAALKNELLPIVCVGEQLAEREKGATLEVVTRQLKAAFRDVAIHDFDEIAVAYEPVWAIGTGKQATLQEAEEVHHFIRTWLTKYFDAPTANLIRILYGGSVNPEVAPALMKVPHVDGLLVGGVSLEAESFAKIIKFEERMR